MNRKGKILTIQDAARVECGDTVYTRVKREPVRVIYKESVRELSKNFYRFTVEFADGKIAKYSHVWLLV